MGDSGHLEVDGPQGLPHPLVLNRRLEDSKLATTLIMLSAISALLLL